MVEMRFGDENRAQYWDTNAVLKKEARRKEKGGRKESKGKPKVAVGSSNGKVNLQTELLELPSSG